jgi:hypothetical protein
MLLIYLPQISTRATYVFDLIFNQDLGIEYRATTDIKAFEQHSAEKINYSNSPKEEGVFIKPSPLLFEDGIKKQKIKVVEKYQTKILFPNDEDDLGFDIFSAVFYMVSRYEEYLPFIPDKFGRFKAADSLAFQNNFLQKPIVNIWINILKNVLQEKFPSLKTKSSEFNAILTYDIDVAYKYRGRSPGRIIGASLKDLSTFKIKNIIDRKKTLLKIQKDPWDVYDNLKETIIKNSLEAVFFFLVADKTKHDRNLSYKNSLMKSLIQKIESFSKIGIHPSFTTSDFPEKISTEKERLENLSGEKIIKSRQHYLKFKLPDTYNSLLSAGIKEDYSMGFPEVSGFRAGTCKPFYVYDLKNEKITDLKILPVTCMDATFIYYSKKSPEKSLLEILNLLKETKKVEGTFIPIFHNEYLGKNRDNKKWRMVHDKTIMQINAYLKK